MQSSSQSQWGEVSCSEHQKTEIVVSDVQVPALSVEVYLRSRGSSRRQSHPGIPITSHHIPIPLHYIPIPSLTYSSNQGIPLSPGNSLTESLNRLALGEMVLQTLPSFSFSPGSLNSSSADLSENAIRSGHKVGSNFFVYKSRKLIYITLIDYQSECKSWFLCTTSPSKLSG